ECQVWGLEQKKQFILWRMGGASLAGLSCLAVSPDGRRFPLGIPNPASGKRGKGQGWGHVRPDPPPAGPRRRALGLTALGMAPVRLLFHPDGQRLLALCHLLPTRAGEVRVWDLRADAPGGPTIRPAGPLADFDLGPDGRHLAVAAGERVQVWDLRTG